MNCNEAQLNILLNSSGELSDIQRQDLNIHLENCNNCVQYNKMNKKIINLAFREMPDNGPSMEILENINEQAQPTSRRSLIFRRHIIQWTAAAALVLIVLGNWTFIPHRNKTETEISDIYAILTIVTDNAYTSDKAQTDIIPDMETLLLQMEDYGDNYDLTEEELWVPQPKYPQSYNTRGTQQKIYG